jgi:type I restriction enzyme M protein
VSKNEKITDFFIGKLLTNAKIAFTPNSSNIKEVQDALKTASKKGTGRQGFPEFTAISKDFILVVEDKASLEKQANYDDEENTILSLDKKSITDYAENGALHYAKEIIAKTSFKKIFAFGCSGNEKHHIIRPFFVDASGYKLLKPVENFENFSAENIEKYYKEQVLGETPPEILETEEIIKKAGELHEMLRNYGQLRDTEKPLVVSAILLALSEKTFKIEQLEGDSVKTDGDIIFDALISHMKRVEVQPEVKKQQLLNQFIIIKDRTILNKKDERLKEETGKETYLEKSPLRYFTEYIQKNIMSSIKANTSEDILGKFYGEFISYGGGDGQTLGVVLTPKHVTELFCDLIDLKTSDNVFDPCCGTGGFLISAMHKMLEQAKPEEIETIKKHRLHGIEIREDMFAIASTNMILRGDGKSNLLKDDFLRIPTNVLRAKNYTVGFINPPYSQAKGKDTSHLSEIYFTEHLLDGLADNGRCVLIVPQSTMVGKTKEDKAVKKRILEKHTLEGVITLNKETFYGVGTNPCIAIFTAHKPHSENKFCKFINYEDDGFAVRKHLGLIETERAKERKAHLINCWLHDAPAETKFMVKTTIEPEDEWLHSFYYFNDEIPKDADFEKTISDYLTFEFNMIMQGRNYLFENEK